jgi:hypothetical protein
VTPPVQGEDGTAPRTTSLVERIRFSAILPVITALGVAYIGYMGTILIQETKRQEIETTALANNASMTATTRTDNARIAAAQQQFEASENEKKRAFLQQYIPKMLSKNDAEQLEAIAILQEFYPNDARDIRNRLATTVASAPRSQTTPTPSAAATTPVPTAVSGVPTPLPSTAVATETPPASQATVTTPPVLSTPPSVVAPRTGWLIVAGSDSNLPGAEAEVERARTSGYSGLAVYKRQGWFATTIGGSFPNETDAKSATIGVRAKIRDSAFVVDQATWCPAPKDTNRLGGTVLFDYYECDPG